MNDIIICDVCGEPIEIADVRSNYLYPFPCSCCNDKVHKIQAVHHAKCFFKEPETQMVELQTSYLKEPVQLGLELIKDRFGDGRKGSYYDQWGYKLVQKIQKHSNLSEKEAAEIAVDFLDSLFDHEKEESYNPKARGYQSIKEIASGGV